MWCRRHCWYVQAVHITRESCIPSNTTFSKLVTPSFFNLNVTQSKLYCWASFVSTPLVHSCTENSFVNLTRWQESCSRALKPMSICVLYILIWLFSRLNYFSMWLFLYGSAQLHYLQPFPPNPYNTIAVVYWNQFILPVCILQWQCCVPLHEGQQQPSDNWSPEEGQHSLCRTLSHWAVWRHH